MAWRHEQEYEPLLPLGFHRMTVSALRALCVEADMFTLSRRRATLMDNITMVLHRVDDSWIVGEVWINGSFLTKKIDPNDVDMVLHVGGGLYNEGYPRQKEAIDWVISNLKNELSCETYHLFNYESSHPLHVEYTWNHAFYHKWFGWSEGMEPKGIAVIRLPGGLK